MSYALAGNPDGPPFLKRGHVEINGADVQDFAFDAVLMTHAAMGYVTNTFTFLAFSQQTSLRFVSTTVGTFGSVIDNVKVTP